MSLLARFRRDRSGNVGIIFGLALLPLLGMSGAAIDFARASSARGALANALDSAALMAARDAPKLSDGELRGRAVAWVKANLANEPVDISDDAISVRIDRTARTITVDGRAGLQASMTRVIGMDRIEVAAEAQSNWGTNTIELALVLDNTGSMASSGKMAALKEAARNLVKTMKEASAEKDQIRISIVPFATQVRLDTKYAGAEWLRFGVKKRNSNEAATKANWSGCVMDRDQPYDASDAGAEQGKTGTLYPAAVCDQPTLARIQPLTSNWDTLNGTIAAMTPVGYTNVTIGAVWGLATLSAGAPFTEAVASKPRLSKYMILLTDGDNTENRFTSSQGAIDDRTREACSNAKASGVKVYTVRVIAGNRGLLRNCASDPSMYFEVSNASQLGPVFQQIAAEISQIRLTM